MPAGDGITLRFSLLSSPTSLSPSPIMRNRIFTIGMSVAFLGAMASPALAATSPPMTQPNFGFLEQILPAWKDAPPVPEALYPTLMQEARATNFLIHQVDRLELGSPTYEQAHRLLLQNLNMMQRQLNFSPSDLAQFNASTHPARYITDQTIYSPDGPTYVSGTADFGTPVFASTISFRRTGIFSGNAVSRTYVGNAPSRRLLVANLAEQTRLHSLAMLP